jgi:hypothetical protein
MDYQILKEDQKIEPGDYFMAGGCLYRCIDPGEGSRAIGAIRDSGRIFGIRMEKSEWNITAFYQTQVQKLLQIEPTKFKVL